MESISEECKALPLLESALDIHEATRTKSRSKKTALLYLVAGIFCAVALVEASVIFSMQSTVAAVQTEDAATFPLEQIEINRNRAWEEGSTPESDALWNTGIPGVTGWVSINNPRSQDLPIGIPTSDERGEIYITTWGHQHHCLKILRTAFWKLIMTENEFVGADSHGNGVNKETSTKLHHLMHCFDYLRQTTSCGADMTLEGLSPESTAGDLDIDGYGVEHSCKNRAAVQKFLMDHQPHEPWLTEGA